MNVPNPFQENADNALKLNIRDFSIFDKKRAEDLLLKEKIKYQI